MRIKTWPWTECQSFRLKLAEIQKSVENDTTKFGDEAALAARDVDGRINADAGAQCALGAINERGLTAARAIGTNAKERVKIAEIVRDGFGAAKPDSKWVAKRAMIEHSKAMAACVQGRPPNPAMPSDCLARTKATAEELSVMAKSIGNSWRELAPNTQAAALMDKSVLEIQQISRAGNALTEYLRESIAKSDKLTQEFKARRDRLEKKYDCDKQKAALKDKVKRASVAVTTKTGAASGFYVKTVGADGKEHSYFVTAHHVAREQNDLTDQAPKVQGTTPSAKFEAGAALSTGDEHLMETKPGRVDRGNDIVTAETTPRADALAVPSTEQRPKVGDEYYLTGHPAADEGDFSLNSCTFYGYGRNANDGGTAYMMDCPSAAPSMGGNSGGALVDRNGTAYGLLSGQDPVDYHKLYISPLTADQGGNLQYGVQQTFVSDDCVDPYTLKKYRCQIIPGISFTNFAP